MYTIVTKRGQTVIPALIRRRYAIEAGDKLCWIDDGETIRVIPIPSNPLSSLRGRGRGEKLLEKLLLARQEERNRES